MVGDTNEPGKGAAMPATPAPPRALADRLELAELVARLGHWLDDKAYRDPAAIRDIYTDDVVAEFPSGAVVTGAAELSARAAASHDRHAHTHHVASNVVVDLADDGETARVRANQTATFAQGAAPDVAVGERYDLHAVRTAAGWRFDRVRITLSWRA
jgi:ketosteroid isomerase-like protein